jgi:hypothetical protein
MPLATALSKARFASSTGTQSAQLLERELGAPSEKEQRNASQIQAVLTIQYAWHNAVWLTLANQRQAVRQIKRYREGASFR